MQRIVGAKPSPACLLNLNTVYTYQLSRKMKNIRGAKHENDLANFIQYLTSIVQKSASSLISVHKFFGNISQYYVIGFLMMNMK